jgi:hypothetical protein
VKQRKISLFDLLLLLLVILVGAAAYWQLHHTTVSQPESAEVLLGDIRRGADRYTDQDAMKETENYNISYTVRIKDLDEEQLSQRVALGDTVYNMYSNGLMGELKSASFSEKDGVTWAELTIGVYAMFYKTHIVTIPAVVPIKTGGEASIRREDGTYIGTGIITWISH